MPNSKLVIFTDSYPYGSAEPFLANELEYLAVAFGDILIIPLNYGTSKKAQSLPANVTCTKPILNSTKNKAELAKRGLLNCAPIGKYLGELLRGKVTSSAKAMWSWSIGLLLSRAILSSKQVSNVLEDDTYTTLYFYWGVRSSFIVPFISENCKNIAVRFHGSDTYEETNGGYIPLRSQQLAKVNKCYFCSEYGRKYVESKYPFVTKKAEIARLGVHDRGICQPSTDGVFRILTLSNMVPLKRLELLVEALMQASIRIEWTHIGDGETWEVVTSAALKLPQNVKATFLGRQPNAQVIEYLTKNPTDLFVNVSSSEGVPVSIMEALSMGIPVLATAVGGSPEIVDDTVGKLVSANVSAVELMHEIEDIAKHRSYETLRSNARNRWAERCDASALYQQFCQSILNI
ncbi:glycosyltransferase [uncultured Acetobacteroides sp.]|uniref:glycosyltransferase n=1 Tax=uncultured Acetobacteroides sp. TaxID=1760811 RepID=UPI0029F56673|nr:glycosyltransferase [uncultured Acetobacteroides sp.]